jgi:hypothetical protein
VKLDRGEAGGIGIALLLHVGLVVALTTSLASVPPKPEAPAMEVEVVDSKEIALTAAAPSNAPPPPSQAPQSAEIPEITPAPALVVQPTPAPPQPVVRPTPAPAPARKPAARPAPPKPQPRVSRIGDDFLKGIADAPPAAKPAEQSAATFSAAAKASVDQAIKRQIQPCADRQPALGAGAERIRVVLNLRLDRDGRLTRPPSVVRTSGVDDDNARYEDQVTDQAIRVYRGCSPLRLPAELYRTPQGGWGNINMTYRVP